MKCSALFPKHTEIHKKYTEILVKNEWKRKIIEIIRLLQGEIASV